MKRYLPPRSRNSFRQPELREEDGAVAVARAVERGVALVVQVDLALLGHAHRHTLRVVLQHALRHVEAALGLDVLPGRLIRGEAVHQVDGDFALADLIEVAALELDEGAAGQGFDHALDDAAEARRHAAVEHDGADFAAFDRGVADLGGLLGLLAARAGDVDPGLLVRGRDLAADDVARCRELAPGDLAGEFFEALALEAVALEGLEMFGSKRVQDSHAACLSVLADSCESPQKRKETSPMAAQVHGRLGRVTCRRAACRWPGDGRSRRRGCRGSAGSRAWRAARPAAARD
jgi:hypothetical protein